MRLIVGIFMFCVCFVIFAIALAQEDPDDEGEE